MKHLKKFSIGMVAIIVFFASCKKDANPVIVIQPSSGSQVQFNGIVGAEPGTSAGNSVYLDLSTNTMTPVARAGWDLGFYSGSGFRVILNNTASAGAKVLTKTDLASVNAADTIGLTLAVNHADPQPSEMAFFDEMSGSLTGTVIPEISATDANNKVILINRGTGGGIPARPWIKMRISRNISGGYTVQYGGITATTFKTLQVPKNADYHFQLVSFDNGLLTTGQPEKDKWDIMWSYFLYQTNFGNGMVPYNYADMIAVNHLSNVQVKEKIYADATIASAAYTAFNKDSINASANAVAAGRWTIGANWRSTMPATGARTNRFYIIKDADGNYYKFKPLAMGVGSDGGTRGKPEFRYDLIQ